MRYHLYGSPMPKERPRFGRMKQCKDCPYNKLRTITPKKTKQWELDIQKQLVSPKLITGPVVTRMYFYLKQERFNKIDLDNLEKAVSDAMNGICFRDDKQIVESHTYKFVADEESVTAEIKRGVPS